MDFEKNKVLIIIVIIILAIIAIGIAINYTPQANTTNNNNINETNDNLDTTDINYGTITQTNPDNLAAGLTHNVRISNLNFNPPTITINAGDTISWRNEDSITHTVVSDGLFDSGDIGQGVIFEYRFVLPGEYTYHCEYHTNTTGKVIVN